jgi:hypothetical protein
MATDIIVANSSLPGSTDKMGRLLIELKNALVGTGLWVVTGSSDGLSLMQNQTQTAGVGGSYDVFATTQVYMTSSTGTGAGMIGNNNAWYQLKEVGTTRTLQVQREVNLTSSASYSGRINIRFCPGGTATSGATTSLTPAPVGTSTTFHGSMSTRSGGSIGPSSNTSLQWDNTNEVVWNLGVRTTPGAGGVCAFYMTVINKATNVYIWGTFYESMLDTQAGDAHPYLMSFSDSFANTYGFLGTQSAGPFWSSTWRTYGATCAPWIFDYTGNSFVGTFPGASYPAIPADGIVRASYCRARTATLGYVGRSEHFVHNTTIRDYPTTFNLSSTTPNIALGQLIAPWKQNIVPGWGP